jgi:hypothetical protein
VTRLTSVATAMVEPARTTPEVRAVRMPALALPGPATAGG